MRVLRTSFLVLATVTTASAWGRDGHEMIAKLASIFLTPSATKQVGLLLDGQASGGLRASRKLTRVVCGGRGERVGWSGRRPGNIVVLLPWR